MAELARDLRAILSRESLLWEQASTAERWARDLSDRELDALSQVVTAERRARAEATKLFGAARAAVLRVLEGGAPEPEHALGEQQVMFGDLGPPRWQVALRALLAAAGSEVAVARLATVSQPCVSRWLSYPGPDSRRPSPWRQRRLIALAAELVERGG